ncbi:hypothetical protein HDU76_013521, partial [Blyttiomyces sp. JEL0837]
VQLSAGKSDAVFFSTHDDRFLFKTLRGSEPENLKSFLPDFLSHISRYPDTLLPRYLGLYCFETLSRHTSSASTSNSNTASSSGNNKSPVASSPQEETILSTLSKSFSIVAMANVFDTDLEIHERYDFKGSTVGRQTLGGDIDSKKAAHRRSISPTLGGNEDTASQAGDGGTGEHQGKSGTPVVDSHIGGSSNKPFMEWMGAKFGADSFASLFGIGKVEDHHYHFATPTGDQDFSNMTLKELDFQRLVSEGRSNRLHVGGFKKQILMKQMECDVELLKKHGFMDYSVLVGIHRKTKPRTPEREPPQATVPTHENNRATPILNTLRVLASPGRPMSLISMFGGTKANNVRVGGADVISTSYTEPSMLESLQKRKGKASYGTNEGFDEPPLPFSPGASPARTSGDSAVTEPVGVQLDVNTASLSPRREEATSNTSGQSRTILGLVWQGLSAVASLTGEAAPSGVSQKEGASTTVEVTSEDGIKVETRVDILSGDEEGLAPAGAHKNGKSLSLSKARSPSAGHRSFSGSSASDEDKSERARGTLTGSSVSRELFPTISERGEVGGESGHDQDDSSDEESLPDSSSKDSTADSFDCAFDAHMPISKQFKGGMKSEGLVSDVIEYEVYFIGMIDILQKFNFAKWIERSIQKRQIFTGRPGAVSPPPLQPANSHIINVSYAAGSPGLSGTVVTGSGALGGVDIPSSLAGLFGGPPSLSSADDYLTPQASTSPIDSACGIASPANCASPEPGEDPASSETVFSTPEISVEEPGRYASRLMKYMDSVFV